MASLLNPELDLPLADTPASRFLGWLAGGLVFLAVLAFAAAAVANGKLLRLALEPRFLTVALPAPKDLGPPDAGFEQVLAALKRVEGVAFVRPVPPQELRALGGAFLTEAAAAPDLPLPRLVDVAFNPGRQPALAALTAELAKLVPGAVLEEARPGRSEADRAARSLRALALGSGLLVIATLLAAVVVVTRMSLDLHHETVDLLRLMGAPDAYVARQFEHHALGSALRGDLLGFTLAMLAVLGLVLASASSPEGGLPAIGLAPSDWLLLGCVPVLAALLTALASRATARWGLSRLR